MSTTLRMTPKQRMLAAMEGREVDCYPVAAPYIMLSDADHWEELTGLPIWKFYEWQYLNPQEHAKMYRIFREKLPFDIFQPWFGSKTEVRDTIEFIHRGDGVYMHNNRIDYYYKVPSNIHNSGSGGSANEVQKVFCKEDIQREVVITTANEILYDGSLDYLMEVVKQYGDEHFIISGGIINTFYSCSFYVGLTNMFSLLYDEPEMMAYLREKLLEQNIEHIRAMAKAGGDAIYIDDAMATNDMISVDFYEKYCLPHMIEQVKEIQRLEKKAIIIYFGGIADRIDQILSIEADAIIMEASMKSYVNDYVQIREKVRDRTCLFGNLDPYGDLQESSEENLYRKMKIQFNAGAPYRRFVTSTGSPITPGTPISRIQRYIEMGHNLKLG